MVTNLERAVRPTHPTPAFPLSAPPHEALTTFKPVNGAVSLDPKDIFLSPNPFASSSSEDDSGNSSGQDEFHLERYSQDNKSASHDTRPSRKQSRRQKQQVRLQDKKTRPGLNIVTDFTAQSKRSNTDGLLIDQVQAQRPRLGPRYATSIKSAKAEHMERPSFDLPPRVNQQTDHSKRAIARQAVSKLQESQAARMRAAEGLDPKETTFAAGRGRQITDERHLETPISTTSGHSPGARSIVIGMSIPEDQIDAHRSAGGGNHVHSANTPGTPAIVITPAEETDTSKPTFLRNRRPSSSVYSYNTRHGFEAEHDGLPPIPKIPPGHSQLPIKNHPVAGATILHPSHYSHSDRRYSIESEDGAVQNASTQMPRTSTDSEGPILSQESYDRRHKSQGWWNLMLSPMLSRKGTVQEKGRTSSPKTPPVPSIPAGMGLPKTNTISPLTADSPDTPRRAGMASARASVWSRWTTWERERDGGTRSGPEDGTTSKIEQPRDMIQDSNSIPSLSTVDYGKGLAAEYYHACAIEQLSGISYFECENHSCSEQLPRLQSIFEKDSTMVPSATSRKINSNPLEDAEESERKQEYSNDTIQVPTTVSNRGLSLRSEPEELSPNVRQADMATVVKARTIKPPAPQSDSQTVAGETQTDEPEPSSRGQAIPPSPHADRTQTQYPNIAAITTSSLQPPVLSPGPVSPGMQRAMVAEGAVPMSQIDQQPNSHRLLQQPTGPIQPQVFAPPPVTIHNHSFFAERAAVDNDTAILAARKEAMERLEASQASRDIEQPSQTTRQAAPSTKETQSAEKKEKKSIWAKLRHLLPKKKMADTIAPSSKKKRRWTLIISLILFLIVLVCILLATLLTRTGDGTPVQSQWLNLTGYPPIPTGISTIARPDVVKQQSKCVAPNTMWSCALPKEDQFEVAPNSPDQPNFRFQIAFKNGTVPANMTIPVQDLKRRSISQLAERANDPFTNDLFTPNPSPPSRADQIFMGNTTDNNTHPFEGEQTPFFITFIPIFPVDPSNVTATASVAGNSKLRRRQASNSSDNFIPAPDVLDDGSAAPANLLPTDPFPTSQPIRLYNRGLADEHYGFYMYYDKAIFLHSTAPLNFSEFTANGGIEPEDQNGGSTRDQSQLRCTFSQTRFLVRMWTNSAFGATLLPAIPGDGSNSANSAAQNSATDFSRPGSFPYPTTISIDRHGGNINKKAVYCYGVNQLQVIQNDVKTIVGELRNVEGTIINPAPALVNGTVADDSGFDQEAGGIDGGTGGCECVWQNWS